MKSGRRSRGRPSPRSTSARTESGYVIVNTERQEIDYQDRDNDDSSPRYEGEDGIKIGSGVSGFVRKAAFALRFGDINPLISGNIQPDSQVLLRARRHRPAQRRRAVPRLRPRPVPRGGRRPAPVRRSTATRPRRNYPNAQRADTGGLDPESGLYGRSFNYVRNSVKAVVDAYDGTVTLYVVDEKDPLIKAYQQAFPELFTAPGDDGPRAPRAHFRYPEDLFTVQTQMWGKYHVRTTPTTSTTATTSGTSPRRRASTSSTRRRRRPWVPMGSRSPRTTATSRSTC